jgi:peptide/nickel transport system ATP-binding protein
MAQRVALMYAGQIVEVQESESFFRDPKHPYARALLRALPDARRRGEPLAAIAGTVPPLTQRFDGCRYAPRCDRAMAHCATTVPEMIHVDAQRNVRCLLYAPGATGTVSAAGRGQGEGLSARTVREAGTPLLDVRELRVRFPIRKGALQRVAGYFDAVDGVSFRVDAGRTLALVGESGCGKTTTGKAIVQLLRRQAVINGTASLEGRNLFELEDDDLRAARRRIQIIFQDPFASLDPRMRVAEILDEGVQALRPELQSERRRAMLEELVEQVGLRREALQRYPHEFSGGQRQRIAIARALAVQPSLIVCDEPTSALDVSVQAQILNLLEELQHTLGVSYLFITHNIGVVEYIADEVAVMKAGRIVEQGGCDAVLGRPQHEYTKTLLAAVPRLETV